MTDTKPKEIQKYDKERLLENAGIGMSKVDPKDIRPPRILLLQKSSSFSDFIDNTGKTAKVGQFFHTGKMKTYETVKCNFLFAAKGKYQDRREDPPKEKEQYQALAVLAEDDTLFAITFRSSALYALSPVFGIASSQRVPMFALNCEIETKKLSGEKGEWLIPVIRVIGVKADERRLAYLEEYAKQFDAKADELAKKDFASKDDEIEADNDESDEFEKIME